MKLPTYYCKNIFDVPVSFFKKIGIKHLLCDLDNTLDTYDILIPSDRVFKLKESLEEQGITLYIISNNKGKRVSCYADALKVKYLKSTRKPFSYKLKKFLIENNINKDESILVGDQLVTDVPCGINAGIKVLLCDKLSSKDQWTTHFNRLIDEPRRKRLKKKGILKYLGKDDYGD